MAIDFRPTLPHVSTTAPTFDAAAPSLSGLEGDPAAIALALDAQVSRRHQQAARVSREIAGQTREAHRQAAIDKVERAARLRLGSAVIKASFEIVQTGAELRADEASSRLEVAKAQKASADVVVSLQKQATEASRAARGARLLAKLADHVEPLQHRAAALEANRAKDEVQADRYQRYEQDAAESLRAARQSAEQAAQRLQSISQIQHDTRLAAIGRI